MKNYMHQVQKNRVRVPLTFSFHLDYFLSYDFLLRRIRLPPRVLSYHSIMKRGLIRRTLR